ncbi:MAG: GNAT family N-acetyltransferase [Saccharofermentanales bacterium]
MKTIHIRRAVQEDAGVLSVIIRSAMTKYKEDSGITGSLDSLKETQADIVRHIGEDTVLIAFHMDEAIGTVRISELSPSAAEISRFAVLPSAQRTGVGSKLFNEAEKIILLQGFSRIMLHTALSNHPLVRFYSSKGFEHTGTSTERGYPRGTFVKNLQPGI